MARSLRSDSPIFAHTASSPSQTQINTLQGQRVSLIYRYIITVEMEAHLIRIAVCVFSSRHAV